MFRWESSLLALLVLFGATPSLALAQDGGVTHVVRQGETLSNLAQQYLGDGERWPEIAQANEGRISDPNLIPTGVELLIPAGSGFVPATVVGTAELESAPDDGASRGLEPLTTEERNWNVEQADGGATDAGRTVFATARYDQVRRVQVRGEEESAYYAVPPDVFYSAEWLVPGPDRPMGGGALRDFVTMPEARRFQGTTVRPFDRVSVDLVDGFSPALGDEVQVFRVIRRDEMLGWVVKPTGSLTIVKNDGESVVGEVNRQFHSIVLGDRIRAAPWYPLQRGQLAMDAELGSASATIMGWGNPRRLQQVGDVAFLDVGTEEGVAVGDEYIIAAETGQDFNDKIAGRLQIVGVGDESSSARIVAQDGPVFRSGTVVYLARTMR